MNDAERLAELDRAKALFLTDRVAAGAIFSAVRDSFATGKNGLWTKFLGSVGFRYDYAQAALRAFDPVRYPPAKPYAQRRGSGAGTVSSVSAGELHEAVLGFRAMMIKAESEPDIRLSDRRRVVAFQHFKFLLRQSNLPDLMKMSPDQIIDLIRKI